MQQTIFISGAGRGLGWAIAEQAARRGDRVYDGFNADPPPAGNGIIPVALDITRPELIEAAVRQVAKEAGSLDCLINNAAILGPLDRGADEDLDYAAILKVFEVNALGSLRMCSAFWPLLALGTRRLIVTISSEAGSIGQCQRDGWFGYGMSKAALNMMSAQFHNAIRPKGGRVMLLHPGWVRTWMQGKLDTAGELSPDESAAALLDLIAQRGSEVHDHPLYLDYLGRELPW